MQTQTIYKHWFGALLIWLAGVIPMSLLYFFATFGGVDSEITRLLADSAVIVIGLITIVQLYVYQESKVTLASSGIHFLNYQTLFVSDDAECDWNTVQSIDAKQTNIFAKIFGYGTLLVQTADARPNLSMPYVPRVEYWNHWIDQHATLGGSANGGSDDA